MTDEAQFYVTSKPESKLANKYFQHWHDGLYVLAAYEAWEDGFQVKALFTGDLPPTTRAAALARFVQSPEERLAAAQAMLEKRLRYVCKVKKAIGCQLTVMEKWIADNRGI